VANEPVSTVALIVDGGWGGDQVLNLTSASVNGNTFNWPAATTGAAVDPTTVPMYVYLYKVSGSTPAQIVDEALTSTQGDTGGQYRAVDGMYMYNFPVSNLPDPSATYQIGISPTKDGAAIPNAVQFGLK
jgi:hypothetical protein